jgi:hypothetical protein
VPSFRQGQKLAEPEHLVAYGGATAPRGARTSSHIIELDLDGKEPNVALEIMNLQRALANDVPDFVVDLVEIATYVYCADQVVSRGGESVLATGEGWRRNFLFCVPVRRPDLWSSDEISEVLKRTLSFLSDDSYEFSFTRHSAAKPLQSYLPLQEAPAQAKEIEQVLLFSGGLDSLAGAVREAVVDEHRVALVSHRSSPKISSRQKFLVEELHRFTRHAPLHIPVWAHRQCLAGREYTQRTRSFLFASLAFAVARVLKLDRIRFYENGVVSLNLPISEQAIGARATRTTHPKVLKGFAQLFGLLLQAEFVVENPFLWMTRAEIVNVIGDAGCGELIRNSVSCMHTHEQTATQPHCGRCSQCVGRRFATLASKYQKDDPVDIYRVDLLTGERDDDKDRTLVESFMRNSHDMRDINEFELNGSHGEIIRVLRHVPGLNANEVALKILELHRKHGDEVARVMEEAVRNHSSEILDARLPESCAIILSLPEKYKARSKQSVQVTSAVAQNSPHERSRSRPSKLPYSPNDDRVYQLIGEAKFKTLTNDEIRKRFGPRINRIFGKNKRSLNAIRSLLNRIRRHWDLPSSQEILKGASRLEAARRESTIGQANAG